jgi:hypothetical protein
VLFLGSGTPHVASTSRPPRPIVVTPTEGVVSVDLGCIKIKIVLLKYFIVFVFIIAVGRAQKLVCRAIHRSH